MATKALPRDWLEIEEYVASFEAARARGDEADLVEFAPAPEHPLYRRVLCELIRVDLELDWRRGNPKRIDEYCDQFPELRDDAEAYRQIALEDARQRELIGAEKSATDDDLPPTALGVAQAEFRNPSIVSWEWRCRSERDTEGCRRKVVV